MKHRLSMAAAFI